MKHPARILILVAGALLLTLAGAKIRRPQAAEALLSGVVLRRDGSEALALSEFVRAHRLTVILFASTRCPCFSAHRDRLATLARDLESQDVRFLLVDSEPRTSGQDVAEALTGAGLPVFRDESAALARRLDARFAAEAFVLDTFERLRYRGGIDSDRTFLTAAPRNHLRDALASLLAGTAPPLVTKKALGCLLRLR